MHPDDTQLRHYLYGLTLAPERQVHWVFGHHNGPQERDRIFAGLRTVGDQRLQLWLARHEDAGREIELRVLALVENAWEEEVREALLRALVQAGHPVQNEAAGKYRAYRAEESPPEGYMHVCSMWERVPAPDGGAPEEVCWYVSWSRHSASRWIHGMKWAASNPKNQRPNAPHLRKIREIVARGREPYGRVEATVPAPDKAGARPGKDGAVPKDMRKVLSTVRAVRERLGVLAADADE